MAEHTNELVLWGYHANHTGPAGVVPIKLFAGTQREINGVRAAYVRRGGWTLGTYKKFDVPTGLRLQCQAEHGTPEHVPV